MPLYDDIAELRESHLTALCAGYVFPYSLADLKVKRRLGSKYTGNTHDVYDKFVFATLAVTDDGLAFHGPLARVEEDLDTYEPAGYETLDGRPVISGDVSSSGAVNHYRMVLVSAILLQDVFDARESNVSDVLRAVDALRKWREDNSPLLPPDC